MKRLGVSFRLTVLTGVMFAQTARVSLLIYLAEILGIEVSMQMNQVNH
jgi:hypothetical protein